MAEPAHRRLQSEIVETALGPMEVARCGSGSPVVVVHGTPGTWRQAAGLALDLADRHTVVLPTRPGYGATPVTVGRTPAEQADAYRALLDALGLGAVGVVGISGGGPSSAQLAHRFPGQTSALVLCCALAAHLMTPPRPMRLALRAPLLAELGSRLQRVQQRRGLANDAATDRRILSELTPAERAELAADPELRDRIVGFYLTHLDAPSPVRGLRNDLRSLGFAPEGSAPDLHAISAPVTVLHGDMDEVVPLSHGRFYEAAIAGARLEVVPGAGHAFLLTFRSPTLERVRAALAS